MTPAQLQKSFIAGTYALAVLLGIGIGSSWSRPKPVVVVAHDQVRNADGTLTAARTADPIKPVSRVPLGSKQVAGFTAKTKPAKPEAVPGADPAKVKECAAILQCPSVTIGGTIAQDKNGQQDLTLSDNVESAVFAPTIKVQPYRPWSAGLLLDTEKQFGAWLTRDIGPVVVGVSGRTKWAEANSVNVPVIEGRIGIRF